MSWIRVAHEDAVRSVGDWRVVNRHRESVVVVRSATGLAAFHNVCQHRGHRLLSGARGCARAFVCPYHHWSYALDGSLRHVPDEAGFGASFDRSEHGLKSLPLEVRDGAIWVRIEGDVVARRTLDEAAGSLADLFEVPDACVVQGVLSTEEAAERVARIESIAPPEFSFSPAFEAYSVGRILDHAHDLEDYFAERPAYEALLARIDPDLEPRILATLQGLAGGTPLRVPVHPEHGPYGPTTIRRYPTGGQIPVHADTEQLGRPSYAHLRTLVRTDQIVSWFLTLQAPDAGGELALYAATRDSRLGQQVYANRLAATETLAETEVIPVRPEAGDLLFFASGHAFHRVTPVVGPRTRWTIGGFVARGLDGSLYAFS